MSTTSARFTSSSPAITRKPGRSANLDADVRQVGIQLDDVLHVAASAFDSRLHVLEQQRRLITKSASVSRPRHNRVGQL